MTDEVWHLDTDSGVLSWRERSVCLTRLEAKCAAAMMSRAPRVVTKEGLFHALYSDCDNDRSTAAMLLLVNRLRHACRDEGMPDPVRVVRAVGWAWDGAARLSTAPVVVPHAVAAELESLLKRHRADTLHYAIFGT